MTVIEIIKKYLVDNGFEGLCTDGCGCGIDDLIPCDSNPADCIPAKKYFCARCKKSNDCEIKNEFDADFCYHEPMREVK